MEKNLVKNYIYNILFQLIKIVAPLLVVPCTMGNLGASVLGISDFANNIASWFTLFGILGINIYGQREIAKVRDNREECSRVFFEILFTQIFNMTIILILYTLYVIFFVKNNQYISYLYCIAIFSCSLDVTWFYFGIENFKIVSIRNIVIKLLGVGLILLIIKEPGDLWKFVLINTCNDVFGHLITYSELPRHITRVKFSFKESYLKHLKATFILFIPTIAINVYTLLDQTMLGILIEDKSAVSLYKTAQNFVKMFLYFITSIGSVMMPRIANVYHNNNNLEEVNRYLNVTLRLSIILSVPMMIAMLCVSPFFIPWYLPTQLSITRLIQVCCPIIVFISLSNVFGIQYLVPTGHNKEYTISVISGAVVNFIFNLLLIPRFGAVGASIGSVIAEMSVTLVQYFSVRQELHFDLSSTTIKSFISAIIMGVSVYFLGTLLNASMLTNIIQAICGVIVYLLVMIVLKEETIHNILSSLLRRKNA